VVVVLSVTDTGSVKEAEEILQNLWQSGDLNTKAVIMVGNKSDHVRTRQVQIDGKFVNTRQKLQFIFSTFILVETCTPGNLHAQYVKKFLLQRLDPWQLPMTAKMWR
jgi:hypothetical protein